MFESEINKLEVPKERPNLVIYCDAGARPNPGFGGRGLHGYSWVPKESKQGSGHPKVKPTNLGYVARTSDLEEMQSALTLQAPTPEKVERILDVDVLFYLDWENSIEDVEVSNNYGEVSAAVQAMIIAGKMNAQSLRIITDSTTTIDGITQWIDMWESNGWSKRDGTIPSNVQIWQGAMAARRKLQEIGCELKLEWVKGHSGDPGNELVDDYATIALLYRRIGTVYNDLRISDPKGYWKSDKERHDFLGQQSIYYHTSPTDIEPGVYYLGGHGKEEDLIGTRSTDGVYSVVKLDEPEPILEKIRNRSMQISEDYSPTFMYALLSEIYNSRNYELLMRHPVEVTLLNNPRRRERPQDLFFLGNNKEVLARQRRPALMAMKAVEALEETHEILIMHQQGDPDLIETDLTDLIYEQVTVKRGKKEIQINQLRSDFDASSGTMKVLANYKTDTLVEQASLVLVMGSDILERNALKRIEEKNPKVTLITWRESAHAFRYATIASIDGAIGIWINYYANLHFTLPEILEKERQERISKIKKK